MSPALSNCAMRLFAPMLPCVQHPYRSSPLLLLLLWLGLLATCPAGAAEPGGLLPLVQTLLPGAKSLQWVQETPPYARVLGSGGTLGYALLTDQVHPIPAYSGKPISTLVAFDTEGRIRGVSIVSHQEPILVVGISDQDLAHYTGQ